MGAPGEYVLCGYGHIIGVIGDDLCWGDPDDSSSVYKEAERLETSRCLKCGRIAKYRICHYGNINDCLNDNQKLQWNQEEDRYVIPISVKSNLNVDVLPNLSLNENDVRGIISLMRQNGCLITHKSKIGMVTISEMSEEYLRNLIMNR